MTAPRLRKGEAMGVRDEHFCSDCKKELDKAKDQYVEAEFPNDKERNRSSRVFLCRPCARRSKITIGGKKVSVWQFMKKLRLRGNPTFEVGVHCHSAPVCETYEPRRGRYNCAHIAAAPDGRIYCKRNHPGFVTLPQEKAVVEQSRFQTILKYVKRFGSFLGQKKLGTLFRLYGLHPDNAKTVTEIGPVGKNITNS